MQLAIVTTLFLATAAARFSTAKWSSPDVLYQVLKHCKGKSSWTPFGNVFDANSGTYSEELFSPRIFSIGGVKNVIPPQINISDVIVTSCQHSHRDPLKVDLKVLGDTLLPGYAKLQFDINSAIDIYNDVTMEVVAYKTILGENILLPCWNNVGSCNYTHQCQHTRERRHCPAEFEREKIPCECPVAKGRFKTDNFKLFLGIDEVKDIPGWLTDGRYFANILIRTGSQQLACLHAEMYITQIA